MPKRRSVVKRKPMVQSATDYEWVDLAGHKDAALTKLLVTNKVCGSQRLDFYISSYAPKAYAEEHVHEKSEEVFYFISGQGLFVLDRTRYTISAGSIVFVPPNTRHGIFNTGFDPLVFAIACSPPEVTFQENYEAYFVAPPTEKG